MKPERLEELLRNRPDNERTYDRQLPDLAMHSGLIRSGSMRVRGGRPLGFAAAAIGIGLVIVVGAAALGPWRQSQTAASPSGSTPTAGRGTTRNYLTGSMKEARRDASATLLKDGRVLIVGGVQSGDPGDGGVLMKSAELYDPATGTFTLTGSMKVARYDASLTTLADGRVLVVGGNGVHTDASAELYDPATGQFTATTSTVSPQESGTEISSTLLRDGRVLIIGDDASGNGDQWSADLYDPSTGHFTAVGQMPGRLITWTATLLNDGRVLIAGGSDPMTPVPSLIFDPATGTFAATGTMSGQLSSHTATLLPDGRVLLIEGYPTGDVALSGELYDPATGKFTPTAGVGLTRTTPTATLLANGTVLLAGGAAINLSWEDAGAVLLYDPSTGKFNPGGSTLVPRREHTATLLSDGRVLLAGGIDGGASMSGDGNTTGDRPTDSAEIYDPTAPLSPAPTTAPAQILDPKVVASFGSDKLSAAVLGPDGAAYVIDSTVGAVYRVTLDTGAKLPIVTANMPPVSGSGVVGRPKLLAVGGSDVLILDDANALWRWHPAPGDKTGRGSLVKVNIPDSLNWGSDVRSIATVLINADQDQYALFITSPSRKQVLKYSPASDGSGYPTDGMSAYMAGPAGSTDVSAVDDMYVDGHVFLVEWGRILRYDAGYYVPGWSTQPPSGSGSPFYMKLTAQNSAPDVGLFYAYDQTGRRIVAFNKWLGKVSAEYTVATGTGLLQSLTGMFVAAAADGGQTIYWTEGGSLMSASLIGAGPSSSP
jgi:hypothetical protein